jgi:hypothetical protein
MSQAVRPREPRASFFFGFFSDNTSVWRWLSGILLFSPAAEAESGRNHNNQR